MYQHTRISIIDTFEIKLILQFLREQMYDELDKT